MKKINLLTLILVALIFTGCNQSTKKENKMIRKEVFGTHKGKEVYLLTLTNKEGNVLRTY